VNPIDESTSFRCVCKETANKADDLCFGVVHQRACFKVEELNVDEGAGKDLRQVRCFEPARNEECDDGSLRMEGEKGGTFKLASLYS
jgi:hypothetical protein